MSHVKSEYSTEGPTCPYCGWVRRSDENHLYDENGYELECERCEATFEVRPDVSWSWTTKAKTWE